MQPSVCISKSVKWDFPFLAYDYTKIYDRNDTPNNRDERQLDLLGFPIGFGLGTFIGSIIFPPTTTTTTTTTTRAPVAAAAPAPATARPPPTRPEVITQVRPQNKRPVATAPANHSYSITAIIHLARLSIFKTVYDKVCFLFLNFENQVKIKNFFCIFFSRQNNLLQESLKASLVVEFLAFKLLKSLAGKKLRSINTRGYVH